jgi:hypothetical protein
VEKQDIIGIIHRAWNNSFTKVESNKKAVVGRGWYHANYILLNNEELRKEKNSKHVHDAHDLCAMSGYKTAPLETLNLSGGTSKPLLDQIFVHKAREDAKNKASLERADEILRKSVENFNTATRIIAGLAFPSNRCVLDQEVRDYAINSERE